MFPHVLDQRLVHLFKYWQDGIRTGMRHRSELYAFVRSYRSHERLQAYDLGCELAKENNQICITCSPQGYTIWVSLTSPFIVGFDKVRTEQEMAYSA